MESLIILVIALTVLTCICMACSPKAFLTPQLVFCACFLPGAVYAFFYVDTWEIDLDGRTLAVIIGGCFLFVAVSFLISLCCYALGKRKKLEPRGIKSAQAPIYIEKWKLLLFLLVQSVTVLWMMATLIQIAGGSVSLSTAIYYYRHTNLFTEDSVSLPGILSELRILCIASGYIWVYLLIHGLLVHCKENRWILAINIALSVTCSVLLGGRGGMIQIAVAALVMWYFLNGKINGWRRKANFKYILYAFGIMALIMLAFQMLGNALGRESTNTFNLYIANYLSAELKNLDTFIRRGQFGASLDDCQTLVYVVNFIGSHFGMSELVHDLYLPYYYIHGKSLGNVATIFYAFLYDGGYLAVAFYTAAMAAISQFTYRSVVYGKKHRQIDLKLIVYSLMLYSVAFSFFSNKFYEDFFSVSFVKKMIYLFLIRWFLMKTRADFKNMKFLIKRRNTNAWKKSKISAG